MSNPLTLQERLDALPPKAAKPFQQLLMAGLLAEDVIADILDAGELSNERSRLIGFAVAYLSLRSQGIPVQDVIRMAKSQKRRVNLGWSAKRWKHEHDRLSRAESLSRLAQENIAYDVSPFESLLPKHFDGYLIRTSRRLGMEGLRQRHCVAGYHHQLVEGACAIASVFVDRQRWTVQLVTTGDPETPLHIAQIKTRHNTNPSGDIRARLHTMLDIPPVRRTSAATHPPHDAHIYMDTLRRILPLLQENHIRTITVEFSGYGDSGSIEHIAYDPLDTIDADHITVRYLQTVTHRDGGQWLRAREWVETSLEDAIEYLTYDYLEETDVDWCNNEGGYGNLVIDVNNGTVALDVTTRYIEDHNAFCAERDILTGEAI